ncbi:MAG: glutamate-5-semialdehyde dehydrogenase [Opitutia bacterium AMD-G3]|jgi:glutamate-5-semialdehyde dehydrogenase|nr:MAG: glutamate-5-semialdehyde dehydrogenase [Opitutae bacterium AMD-G3]
MSDLLQRVTALAQAAKAAARAVALSTTAVRDQALRAAAQALRAAEPAILAANAQDLAAAQAKGLSPALTDRLRLDHGRLEAIAVACEDVAKLPDPVGEITEAWERPNGLQIVRRRVPIGLVAIIFESRPNVTVDAAALCLKSGNACILRGGSEALHTNLALAQAFARGLAAAGLPTEAVTLLPFTDRDAVPALGSLRGIVDIIVPRGGPGLIEAVVNSAKVPVIKHDAGICHIYVHAAADLAMAEAIIVNAKCQRPSACNAAETLLVDAAVADRFLPTVGRAMAAQQTEIRGCPRTCALVPSAQPATEADFRTEHLALVLNIKVVAGLAEAVAHIETCGSHHSDAIITADEAVARSFLAQVDSACVYWNASTRFTDGGEFGFGAEVGISTDRLHARGPMGIRELTTWKFEVVGNGQIRR